MRGGFWLVAAFAAILAAADADDTPLLPVPQECPSVDPTDATVHLAHESDCTKFYVCFLGEKIVKDCPYRNAKGDRLHFNPVLQACDFPENVNCTNKEENPSTTVSPITEIPSTITVFPTTKVSSTTTDFPKTETASTTTVFPTAEDSSTTVRPTTGVPSSTVPSTTNVPPTGIATECPPDNSGNVVHLPHESDCSLYYKCDAGKKVVQPCPPGLSYNPVLQVCDWSGNVNCANDANVTGQDQDSKISTVQSVPPSSSSSIPPSSEAPPSGGNVPTECPPDNSGNAVQLPHETNCSLFYKCDEGEKVVQLCPPGLVFNPVLQVCDFPENVNCTNDAEVPEKDQDSQNAMVSSVPPSGFPPVPSSSEAPPSGGDIPTECPPNNTGNAVQLPHETNCSLFYKCDEGEKVVQLCPPGLVFNPVLQVCDFSENVNCSNKVNVTEAEHFNIMEYAKSNSTPGEIPTECPPDNSGNAVHLPHATNCSLFYKCDEGEKVVQLCPPGLVFNPLLQVCDFPENVDCNVANLDLTVFDDEI